MERCLTVKFSVIIPTYNGEETLRELLAVLYYQTVQPTEILVVDSSSTDGTVALCEAYGAKVTIIPQSAFDHGGTRSDCAIRAAGDIVVFFTQDAVPYRRDAVEKLIVPLIDDAAVAATYGRQIPYKDAGFAARHLRLFNYPPVSATRSYQDRHQLGIRTIFTSNSFAAYKKTALAEVGYFKNGLIFGEDTCTVGRLLQKGYRVAYVAEAIVYHSHEYSFVQEFRRAFDIGVLHTMERDLFADFGRAESRGVEYVKSGCSSLYKDRQYLEIADFLFRVALKFFGYKFGRHAEKLPKKLVPWFSMHRSWWK